MTNFKTITASLNGVSGENNLYFKAKGRLNFNWYDFTGEPKDCGMADSLPVCCEISTDVDRDGFGMQWATSAK